MKPLTNQQDRFAPTMTGAEPSAMPRSTEDDLDQFKQGDVDEGAAEARGGDHREIQDNGTGGRTRNVAGDNTFRGDYPLPPDPHSPSGKDYAQDPRGAGFEISDFGLNETTEVGNEGTRAGPVASSQQGLEGNAPPAGGGDKRNTKT